MASQQTTTGEILPPEERKILILYGSETGNSHDFSIDLETMAERLRFRADVFAIDAITLRLVQLGANEFYPRGEADERHDDGIDGAFLPWLISLRSHLLSEYPLPEGLSPIPQDVPLSPKIIIGRDSVLTKDDTNQTNHSKSIDQKGLNGQKASPGQVQAALRNGEDDDDDIIENGIKNFQFEDALSNTNMCQDDLLPIPDSWTATVECNDRVTPEGHWQDVRQLKLNIHPRPESEDKFCNDAGDSIVIYPKNFPEDVQELIDLMGWNDVADEPFRHYTQRDGALIRDYTPPDCYPVANIRFYASDPMHKERLDEFSDPKFIDEFYDYTTRPRRSILEILPDFPSLKIPYQHVPGIFPLIRGREYSMASAGELTLPKSRSAGDVHVELLVALVKYKTVLRKIRRGLCSRYIESLHAGSQINITLNRRGGPFIQNKNIIERPLLCIATGTGVAPIRAVFWERHRESSHGPDHLFYGARNEKADFFFKDEWSKLDIQVHTAFSRDQREKIYVQDIIRQQSDLICTLIKTQATVAICGSSGAMPQAVKSVIAEVMVQGGIVEPDVDAWEYLVRNNVVWEEVW
ncbi:Zn finger-containing GTPase- Activating Protein for ARF [Pestalotiopsis sp. IQ-011]